MTLGQNQFAQKYNITISETEDQLSKKMKISNEVFDSREELFLIQPLDGLFIQEKS